MAEVTTFSRSVFEVLLSRVLSSESISEALEAELVEDTPLDVLSEGGGGGAP